MKVLLYWSEKPFPSPEDLPDPGIKPGSTALQVDSLSFELPRISFIYIYIYIFTYSHIYFIYIFNICIIYIYIVLADLCCCMEEINTIL